MSGEYWGRPDGQQPSGQNPAGNTNYPTPQPQESANTDQPGSEASAQGWTTPGYGTPAQPEQPAQPSTPSYGVPAQGMPTYGTGYGSTDNGQPAPSASSGYGTDPSTPSYGVPAQGMPTYGTGYGSTDNGQPAPSASSGYGTDPSTPSSGYGSSSSYGTPQPSGYGTDASTGYGSTSDYGSSTSASQVGYGTSTPESSGYGTTDYGTSETGSTGSPLDLGAQSSYPSTAPQTQSYGTPQSGYTQPADGPYSSGGYDSPTPGYGATTDYGSASQGYNSYAQTPQDQYASAGNYGYTTPNYGTALTGPVAPNGQPLASFGKRVLSYLVDFAAPGIVAYTLAGIGTATGSETLAGVLTLIGYGAYFAWFLYNTVYLGGTTGQSWGRKVAKTRLLSEATGQPLGMGMAFLRQLAHAVDGIICDIGYLFPLWDAKRQTIADKIVGSLVVDESSMGTTGYDMPQQPTTPPQQPYSY